MIENSKTPEELRKEFWLSDFEMGGVIRKQYDEIKRVLKECDMAWAKNCFEQIKQHAIDQTEFYKGYKCTDEFPVVNKLVLTEQNEAFTARQGYRTPLHYSTTSGSTGTPFCVAQDFDKRKRTIAELKVFGELADYPSHERMVFFRALTEKFNRTPQQEDRENIYYTDCSGMSDAAQQRMLDAVLEKKPRTLLGYSSGITELAKYAERTGASRGGFSVKSIITSGEGISDKDRQFVESVFGCTVYRRYSDMELGILGQDDGKGGSYLLNWGSYYFECFKTDSDEPAAPGEIGRIVITDLFNRFFPMIRYDTGDLGILETPENELPRLKEIYGRAVDCIYDTEGNMVSPYIIVNTMWGAEGIKQWQFIQEEKDLYVLRVNCAAEVDFDFYIGKLKCIVGDGARIKLDTENAIPVLSSNKRRPVLCNYWPQKH